MITFPRGREIVLGVGAGIAAYKACDLLRRLQDRGFLVTVIPTPSSLNFVGKATWEALSGREVRTEVWEGTQNVSHVAVAEKADLVLVAPATADLIARLANGRADDLLTTTILATTAQLIVVPAMHPGMYMNPATQKNIQELRSRGAIVMEPDTGRLTGADSGIGRFPETNRIIGEVEAVTKQRALLRGRRVLVTTGGTIEPIDPVRYIGNRSSGRQGLAIAYQALCAGADVTVISAATEDYDLEGITRIEVTTALEMQKAIEDEIDGVDVLVMAAAVADARPSERSSEKIAKRDFDSINLVKNPDILADIARQKKAGQVFVGFAAETAEDLKDRGRRKLHQKGVDLLYVTNVASGRVFGEVTTSGFLISKRGYEKAFQNSDKFLVGKEIVKAIADELGAIN